MVTWQQILRPVLLPLSGWWPSSSWLIFYVACCKRLCSHRRKVCFGGASWPNRCCKS